jgi:DNA-binding MarR family transcriptional regulator
MATWKFLSNHAQVLLCIAGDPGIRLRDIAVVVGITERASHRIVDELVTSGYISRERVGRRNQYTVLDHLPVHDPLLQGRSIADLLTLLGGAGEGKG